MSNSIEKGDIYFFYRPKVDVDQPKSLDDIQRFQVVLLPDGNSKRARLFIVGKKGMPGVSPGKADSSEREWMMTYRLDNPKNIGEEFLPLKYETKTRGKQEQAEAIPVAEGRYHMFMRKNSSRLAYALSNPSKPGKVQKEFGIQSEASYVISIRNPGIDVPGFPKEKPDYPKKLQEKFAEERWLDVDDPKLLDYENVQVVLIGAHESLEKTDADITGKADLFGRLGLDKRKWPTEALTRGQMAGAEYKPESKQPRGDKTKAGERGGSKAASTASAAGVAKALKGVDFPSNRGDLIDYAKEHKAEKKIVNTLAELPKRKFKTMADVQKAVGEVR